MNGRYELGAAEINIAIGTLKRGGSVDDAALSVGVTKRHLQGAFKTAGKKPPSSFLRDRLLGHSSDQGKAKEKAHPKKKASTVEVVGDSLGKLFAFTKKEPKTLEEVANHLDVSPHRARQLVAQAQKQGLHLQVSEAGLGFHIPVDERVKVVPIPATVGETQRVAVISDLHYGSKYCLRDRITDFVTYAYKERGVREILVPGDMLDGSYRHGKFEVSHVGLEEQTRDMIENLPRLPGLTYHMISGNHDFTFTNDAGVNVCEFIVRAGRSAGRKDLFAYGDRGAFLKIRGALVHMWHPLKGMGYAMSYPLQKQVEKYSSGEKPDILLAGHWHVHGYFRARGVRAIACPTFQGGGSAFGRALGGSPDIGGLVLSWDLTEHGTLRNFTLEHRAYFEVEKIHRVRGAR
jgi:predicted phosphodiesterase